MASMAAREHPIFTELAKISSRLDQFADPSDLTNYGKCLGLAKKSGLRCGNPPCTQEEKARLQGLLDQFRGASASIYSDELHGQIETFIRITHCYHHRKNTVGAFQESKRRRQSITASESQSLPSSGSGAVTDRSGDASSILSETTLSSSVPDNSSGLEPDLDVDREERVVTDTMSRMSITMAKQSTTVEPDGSVSTATTAAKISKLGITSLQRAGSVRDPSPVIKEIFAHPSDKKMSKGIVYVFKHQTEPGHFKIGWTTHTADERRRQSGNCYGKDTETMYYSKRFAGAYQAESIIHAVMRHDKLVVSDCTQCGGGHREWFRSSDQVVRGAVEGIVKLMQEPAYTRQDGEWKLSAEAHEKIRNMCDFSISKLAEVLAAVEEPHLEPKPVPAVEVISKTASATVTVAVAEIPDLSSPENSYLAESSQGDETLVAETDGELTPEKPGLGKKFAKTFKPLVVGARKVSKNVRHEIREFKEEIRS